MGLVKLCILDLKWFLFCCFYLLLNLFIFSWRIIVLQYGKSFCHTSTWISHRYTYVPSLLNLPPTSHPFPLPLGWYRTLVWIPWVIQQITQGKKSLEFLLPLMAQVFITLELFSFYSHSLQLSTIERMLLYFLRVSRVRKFLFF